MDNLSVYMLDESPQQNTAPCRSWTICLDTCLMSVHVHAQWVSLMRYQCQGSQTTCPGMYLMTTLGEIRQLAWVLAQWPVLGKSDSLPGHLFSDQSLGSQTTCLDTCSMTSYWEVWQLAWAHAQWIFQMRHTSLQKSDNSPGYLLDDHSQGSQTTCLGICSISLPYEKPLSATWVYRVGLTTCLVTISISWWTLFTNTQIFYEGIDL